MAPIGEPSDEAMEALFQVLKGQAPPELPDELKPFANLSKPAVADLEHPTPRAEVPWSEQQAKHIPDLSNAEITAGMNSIYGHSGLRPAEIAVVSIDTPVSGEV